MVEDRLMERHGNMAFSNLRTLFEKNVPFAVAKVLEVLVVVGRFNPFCHVPGN
jgi:hypothetical protein